MLFLGLILLAGLLRELLRNAPKVEIAELSYGLVDDPNNFPQDVPMIPGSGIGKIYLGDRFQISFKVRNGGYLLSRKLLVRGQLSQQIRIVSSGAEQPNPQELSIPIGRVYPFREIAGSFEAVSSISGQLKVKLMLVDPGGGFLPEESAKELVIWIAPRPVSSVPQVPSEIVSYLGDKAVEECQQRFPCSNLNELGSCARYPDSEESKRCLAERNKELFSGCDEHYETEDLTPWYICLMERHGFTVASKRFSSAKP